MESSSSSSSSSSKHLTEECPIEKQKCMATQLVSNCLIVVLPLSIPQFIHNPFGPSALSRQPICSSNSPNLESLVTTTTTHILHNFQRSIVSSDDRCIRFFHLFTSHNPFISKVFSTSSDLQNFCQIDAHRSPLAATVLSSNGMYIATTSEQGTIIRVHLVSEATKSYSFRRGTYPSTIFSLSFAPSLELPDILVATSSSGSVHVFSLEFALNQSSDSMGGDSLLKNLWHHQDAILCCSLKVSYYLRVDCITNQITTHIMSVVNKKNKNANLKAHAVKNHLWIFVNSLIDNPAFDSQTKETLTIRQSSFGSKCELL